MRRACIVGFGRAGRIHLSAADEVLDISTIIDERKSVQSLCETPCVVDPTEMLSPEIDIVIVTTPTETHFDLCRKALESGKHVFVEKPLANNIHECRILYELASRHDRILFTAYNRRHDPEWITLRQRLGNRYPVALTVVCCDHPFPPANYLRTCGSIFRDCAVHDIDMICSILNDYPVRVEASCNDAGEASCAVFAFAKGCRVHMMHSRHSPRYEQRVIVQCDTEIIEMGRTPPTEGTSFRERYAQSYVNQMRDFAGRIDRADHTPNVALTHAMQLDAIVVACETSAEREGHAVTVSPLRNYDEAQERVKNVYRTARTFHTVERTRYLREKYRPGAHGTWSVWEVFHALKDFTDLSDPDVCCPNDQHALQTAESLRSRGFPDWMQLVGLMHDFGKVIFKWGCDEDGTSLETQWSIVGDTFVVGYPMPDELVYPEYNVDVTNELYEKHCGLENCLISFGHDEYLYNVLQVSNTNLPSEALRVVRYHSLYAWHDKDAYTFLEDECDRMVKGWVKLFNSHDLYSKQNKPVVFSDVCDYYSGLIEKYIPNGLRL